MAERVVPVYNIIGLFCADDTEGVDGSVGRCEVGVLSRSAGETPRRALTASQKLTHSAEKKIKYLWLQTEIDTNECFYSNAEILHNTQKKKGSLVAASARIM